MEDVAELLVSTEATGDTCGQSWKIGFIGSEPKKWSSLGIALLMHCALAVAFYASGRPQPACRNDCIEVMLIGSLGGTGVEGAAGPSGPTEAGKNSSKAVTQEAAPSSSVPLPPETPKKYEVRKKPAEHVTEKKKCTLAVPSKKPKPELKNAAKNNQLSKEEPAEKSHDDMTEASSNSKSAVEQGMGSGTPSGTGQGTSDGLTGRSGNGGGGGMGDVAFGSPNGPRFLRKVVPTYPDFARRQEMQGTVLLRVAIDEQGRVVNIEILKKAGYGFDEAAVKAIRESTFIPAKNEGKSCNCKALLPIRFELKSADVD
jgi:protein TonB